MMDLSKRTKIVCTIGPATHTAEAIAELVKAGMNVCRLNFSHGTHEDHAELIKTIRRIRQQTGEPLTILQDLQGPKIRVGELPEQGIELVKGERVVFTSGKGKPPKTIPVTYPNLHKDVKPGQTLLLDDGLLEVMVESIEAEEVTCKIVTGGKLTSHKGLNLPETETSISAITEKDREDIRFGVSQGVDWIALSFVRSPDDIAELRRLIDDPSIKVMAKMEKPQAIARMDEIVAAVDGIMVARGDLGIELPAEKVPIIQKELIAKCLRARKPVIVATQMLDSMIRNPRPTRAEVSDIANAVIDHTDATMLSGETASGAHPIEAVQAMSATIRETEKSSYDDLTWRVMPEHPEENVTNTLAEADKLSAVIVATLDGEAARLVSSHRPEAPIFVGVPEDRLAHQLNLSWGIRPFVVQAKNEGQLLEFLLERLKKEGYVSPGQNIAVFAGRVLPGGHVELAELRTA